MPILKPEKVYLLPEKKLYGTGIEINTEELTRLIQAAHEYLEPAALKEFQEHMQSKVTADSVYAQTRSVRQGLKIIYDYFFHMNTTSSDKASIVLKLAERSAHCPQGFHNGVNAIVEGFYLANSLNELLYRVRRDLVARTANQLTDDVHANNRCFTIAANSGYGVWPLNDQDRYHGGLSTATIQEKLAEVFEFGTRLFSILKSLEGELRSQLANAGAGASEKSYSAEALEKMEAQLSALFHNHPVVKAFINAQACEKTLREPYEKDFLTAKVRLQTTLEDWAIKNFLALTPHKRLKLEFLISGIGEELLPKTWVAALPNIYKQQLQPLIEQLPPIPDALVNAKAQLRHAKQRFNELFFTADKTNVHWPNIRQLLWYGIKQEGYFSFTNKETELIDTLMHPKSDETLCCRALEKIMIEWNGPDLIAAINTFDTIDASFKSTLIERRFKQSRNPYGFFKGLLASLHDPILKHSIIREHYRDYLGRIKEDPSILIQVIPWMDQQDMSTFFKKTRLDDMPLLCYAITKKTQTEVLPLISALAQCPNATKEDVLTQTVDSHADGYNALMLAVRHQPSAVQPILDALATCNNAYSDVTEEVLCGHDSNGMSALMLAVRCQPSAVQPILDALVACNIRSCIINPLAKTNHDGHNALMIAIQYQPTAIQPIIRAMCNYINVMIDTNHFLADYAAADEASLHYVLSLLAQRPLGEQKAFYASWTISSPLLKQRGIKELHAQRLLQTLINNTQILDSSTPSSSWKHILSQLQGYLTKSCRKPNELVVVYKLIGSLMDDRILQAQFDAYVSTSRSRFFMFDSHENDYATTVKQLKQQLREMAPDLHLEQFDRTIQQNRLI